MQKTAQQTQSCTPALSRALVSVKYAYIFLPAVLKITTIEIIYALHRAAVIYYTVASTVLMNNFINVSNIQPAVINIKRLN